MLKLYKVFLGIEGLQRQFIQIKLSPFFTSFL
jgi:hypothetical protein